MLFLIWIFDYINENEREEERTREIEIEEIMKQNIGITFQVGFFSNG